MSRVLIVEDDRALCLVLEANLTARGHEVHAVHEGRAAAEALSQHRADVVLLDLGLPDVDGVEVLVDLRTRSAVPIVVLTARDARQDKVAALDAGADDYVTKPFDSEELAARLRAAVRRGNPPAKRPLVFGELCVDLASSSVTRAGEHVALTRTEYAILEALVTNPQRLLTHDWLLKRVWGPAYGDESTYTRTYIAQLRRKLHDDASHPTYIRTEPGLGYRWIASP